MALIFEEERIQTVPVPIYRYSGDGSGRRQKHVVKLTIAIAPAELLDNDEGLSEEDLGRKAVEMLPEYIRGWDIVGKDGKAIPCDPETVRHVFRHDKSIELAFIEVWMDVTRAKEINLKN